MLGQAAQNEAENTALAERMFEQRTRGMHTFRLAKQPWYGLSMSVMKNRRIEGPAVGGAEAVKIIPASDTTERDKLPVARDWVLKAQADGYGVVVLPATDEASETIVKTQSAELAAKLTDENEINFVLNEPTGDWYDVPKTSSLLVGSAFALVGLVAATVAMETLR